MKILTKLMLTTAILATGGFAATGIINGTQNIGEGARLAILNNDVTIVASGKTILEGSETEGKSANLVIGNEKTLTIAGGELSYDGQGTYKPNIHLSGKLLLQKDGETYPVLKLPDVKISGTNIIDEFEITGEMGETETLTLNKGSMQDYTAGGFNYTKIDIIGGDYVLIEKNTNNIAWLKTNETSNLQDLGFGWKDTGNGRYISSLEGEMMLDVEDASTSYSVYRKLDVDIMSKGGELDMSQINEYLAGTMIRDVNLTEYVANINPASLKTVKLPYNCIFTNVDLSNVDEVYYTRYTTGGDFDPIVKENIIEVQHSGGTSYGDYSDGSKNLGVILPDPEKLIIEDHYDPGVEPYLTLGEVTEAKMDGDGSELKFNKVEYKLNTQYLSSDNHERETHEITSDTTYNFGFIGSKAIAISGDAKAIFKGDSSKYAPTDGTLELPDDVEFAASNSLFPISQEYENVTFAAGNMTNTIPAGKTVTIGNINLGSNHVLNIKGELIL